MTDQKTGGALLWVFGDVAAMLFMPGFFKQWNRAERRENKRTDRLLDQQFGDSPTTAPWWLPPVADDSTSVRRPSRAIPGSRSPR